jgi:hypothetical protein
MTWMSKLLAWALVIGLSQIASAAVGDKEAAVRACTNRYLQTRQGILAGQEAQYYDSPMIVMGFEGMYLYTHFMSGCLAAKNWQLGDTSNILRPAYGTPLSQIMAEIAVITYR